VIHVAMTSAGGEMIALPNRGFLPVGLWSARHTGAVAREEVPAREAAFVNPVAGIPFGM
jgi:hypothetical protein